MAYKKGTNRGVHPSIKVAVYTKKIKAIWKNHVTNIQDFVQVDALVVL